MKNYLLLLFFGFLVNKEIIFISKSDGKVIDGYISLISNDRTDYLFPNNKGAFNFNESNLKTYDSIFFHSNFQKFYISKNMMNENEIILQIEESLDAIVLTADETFYDGIGKPRSIISTIGPSLGAAYLQKVENEEELFISQIEVMIINKHPLFKGLNSYKCSFDLIIGSVEHDYKYIEPNILFESTVTINSKHNGWVIINLNQKIPINDISYLFMAIKAKDKSISIGASRVKKHPDFLVYGYNYPKPNEWKMQQNTWLPLIRYKLSNKAK